MPATQSPERPHRLEDDLKRAADRLKRRFAGQVDEAVIDSVVTTVAGELAHARIKDFVGLLVERRGAEMLRSMLVTA